MQRCKLTLSAFEFGGVRETEASLRFASFSFLTSQFFARHLLLYFLFFSREYKKYGVCLQACVYIYVAFHGACVCNVNTHLVQLYRLFSFVPTSTFFSLLSSSVC